ncbi:hypothetical protein LTR08_006117 [Meristemomyces frigidus]|nr:hypothetical protein LTR08_006117 [Meristemomyces frigidus]
MAFTDTWLWLFLATAAMLSRQTSAQADGMTSALDVIDPAAVQTIIVNRYGSMCPAPTAALSTAPFATLPTPQATGLSTSQTTSTDLSTTAAASAIQSPSASTFPTQPFTLCSVTPVCPTLDTDACLDASNQAYGISCNTTFTGLIAFPPRKLRPRTFAMDLEACLAICDLEGGCQGVSYGFSGPAEQNCLLYGSVTGTTAENGSIAARKITAYGGAW